jgi:hypothetical protein
MNTQSKAIAKFTMNVFPLMDAKQVTMSWGNRLVQLHHKRTPDILSFPVRRLFVWFI